MHISTRLVQFDAAPHDPWHPTSTPIYQTATFEQDSPDQFGAFDYSRSGNPTRDVLEKHLADLEGGTRAFAFASGLAAITAVVRLLEPGDEILADTDLYGGTQRLFGRILPRAGIRVVHADATDLTAFAAGVSPRTKLVYIESPTNPLQRIVDIASAAQIAKRAGATLCVDGTMTSPYLQNPLALGADFVIHSATKYLSGHGDVMAGVAIVKDTALAEKLFLQYNGEGAALAPLDSFLLLRGIKTLAVRMDRQQASAQKVAEFLLSHAAVPRVYFPGLKDHPGHALHARQARGPGAVVSFEAASPEAARSLVQRIKLFATTVSFGSVASSISLPATMSHASVPAALRATTAPPRALVRLSIGLEAPEDLIADLAQALEAPLDEARDGRRSASAAVP